MKMKITLNKTFTGDVRIPSITLQILTALIWQAANGFVRVYEQKWEP